MEKAYKILSLDGGGSWAILQVLTLEDIFKRKYPDKEVRGHEVLKHFDLVIANSGGSMVLAALACNWTFAEITSLFEDEKTRKSIFKELGFRERYFPTNFMRLLGVKSIGTRYSTTYKKRALENILKIDGNRKLSDVRLSELPMLIGKESLEIIVTTFDIINKRAKLFRSNKYSNARAEVIAGLDHFDEVNLVEAIHGSSNAPINYFDFPAIFSPEGTRRRFYLWDGALGGFNNPVMAGLTEAFANGISKEKIHILSIGTGGKLISDEDSDSFRDQYYTTLLGKKVVRTKDGTNIDFEKTKKKSGFFYRLFKGAGFYGSTIANMSQTILFEPQTWASYSAYTSLFAGNLDDKSNSKRFLRLSPQIIKQEDSDELINNLYNLDMDVTEQDDIELLKSCYVLWKSGEIKNEPIQWAKTIHGDYVFARGHQAYNDAINNLDWL